MESVIYQQIFLDLFIAVCCFLSIPLLYRWSKVIWTIVWRLVFPVTKVEIRHRRPDGTVVVRCVDLKSKKGLLRQLDEGA